MALKKLVSDLTQGLVAYPNHNTPSTSGGFNYGSSTSIFDTKLFNQRSLGYELLYTRQDNPYPLIPQLLPGVNEEPENSILYLDDSPDGFIRGGVDNVLKRAAYDNIRMKRFFLTGEGISFIDVQKSLQKTNPIIQEGGGNLNNVLEDVISTVVGLNFTSANTNRIFNHENLMHQILHGNYSGKYYNRAGNNPEIQSEEQNKYEAIHKPGRKFDANQMGEFNKHSGLESGNRLVSLGKKLDVGLRTGVNGNVGMNFNLPGQSSIMEQAVGFDIGGLADTWNDIKNSWGEFMNDPLEVLSENNSDNIGFNPGENIIYQYTGGPGSTYGVGDTILYRYNKTSGDYDHQGHPLSIKLYFEKKGYTIASNEVRWFNADGTFNTQQGLNTLANIANENLFGGNNILGAGGLLFDDNFNFNSGGDILEGVANQIFGEDTVDFVIDLFDGGGVGSPENRGGPITVGSYMIGDIQLIDGSFAKEKLIKNEITGIPKPGFIGSYASSTGKGFANKPDEVASFIENPDLTQEQQKSLKDKLPLGVGTVVTFNGIDPSRYKPTNADMSKDARIRLGEANANTPITKEYKGSHYYSQQLAESVESDNGSSRDYTLGKRVNTGDPGATPDATFKVLGRAHNKVDKINALDIHSKTSDNFNDIKYRDLVKFRFEAVRTDTPGTRDIIAFRAFLDGFSDSYNASWNSFKYSGRGEEMFTYNSFKRTFDLSFKVSAQSAVEMRPIYRKLNFLASTLAPDYGEGGRMRGNYIRLTMGDYMDRTPGFLTSLSIKWQKEYPWEITIDRPETGDTKDLLILPHVLDVSCNFTPIHAFVPKKSKSTSPFILPSDNTWAGSGGGYNGDVASTSDKVDDKNTKTSTTNESTITDSGETYATTEEYPTIYSIGKASQELFGRYINWRDIRDLNDHIDPKSMPIGTTIKLPTSD